ncbi:hypothetical protein COSO111634_04880 [Corallococcus soli]
MSRRLRSVARLTTAALATVSDARVIAWDANLP